jgi:hypothetical protein
MLPRVIRSAVVTLIVLSVSATASATIMVEVPLDEMIASADTIVHGTVVRSAVRVEMRDDGTLEPQTITTIRVREWIAGQGGETVTLRELGGVWQGGVLRYEGTPEYRVGEEVVVFLARRPEAPNDLRTLGMVQGKFLVRHGVPGVSASVHRDLEGIAFYQWANGQQVVQAPGADPAMELQHFLAYVRQFRSEQIRAEQTRAQLDGRTL